MFKRSVCLTVSVAKWHFYDINVLSNYWRSVPTPNFPNGNFLFRKSHRITGDLRRSTARKDGYTNQVILQGFFSWSRLKTISPRPCSTTVPTRNVISQNSPQIRHRLCLALCSGSRRRRVVFKTHVSVQLRRNSYQVCKHDPPLLKTVISTDSAFRNTR